MKFNEAEIQDVRLEPMRLGRWCEKFPAFHYPVTEKEGWRRAVRERNPLWLCNSTETFNFQPDVIPDNKARGAFNDASVSDTEKGGKDMFGVPWVYVPTAGGSMEDPDTPHLFADANDWEQCITWPDIETWDWEGCTRRSRKYMKPDKFTYIPLLNGFGFERLISFMGFENAAVAIIDEEQEDALRALLDKLSDLGCQIVEKCCKYFDVDGFLVHDDWGSQRAPFFSFETARDMLVPYMKKLVDCIHAHGKVAELHSCGKNEMQIENFIAAGWDIWVPSPNINDTQMLFEKYGDRICIGVYADPYDAEKENETAIRAKARAFAERVCKDSEKAGVINIAFMMDYPGSAYVEEIYKISRQIYGDRK